MPTATAIECLSMVEWSPLPRRATHRFSVAARRRLPPSGPGRAGPRGKSISSNGALLGPRWLMCTPARMSGGSQETRRCSCRSSRPKRVGHVGLRLAPARWDGFTESVSSISRGGSRSPSLSRLFAAQALRASSIGPLHLPRWSPSLAVHSARTHGRTNMSAARESAGRGTRICGVRATVTDKMSS